MGIKYQIREFRKGPFDRRYEVWRLNGGHGWEKLKDCLHLQEAEAYITALSSGYYDTVRDYDEHGKPLAVSRVW